MEKNRKAKKRVVQCNRGRNGRKRFVLAALDQFERPLTRYAIRMFGRSPNDSVEAARDVVQYTFMKLVQQEPTELTDKVGPWLYRVCRNRIIDQLRSDGKTTYTSIDISSDHSKTEVANSLADRRAGPHALAADKGISLRLQSLIGQMSGNDREVIELWSQGLSHQEVAKVLEKSPATVRVALYRAIKRLKKHPQVRSWLESWQERATCQPCQTGQAKQANFD